MRSYLSAQLGQTPVKISTKHSGLHKMEMLKTVNNVKLLAKKKKITVK